MGKMIKLEATPLELAQLHFDLGFRADFHKGIKGFRDILSPQANFKSLLSEGEQVWKLLHCLSWKDRHAKGVPVKMYWDDLDHFLNRLQNGDRFLSLYGMSGYELWKGGGNPYAKQRVDGIQVSFCNFRYKPEWMEKKGGSNGTK